jgi:tRNA U34 2-thiouridine synthase MnmA/TrmU
MKRKAVALLSGGLDSILAVRVILDQGIPVTAIRFITHFGCDPVTSGSCGKDVEPLVKMWGHLGLDVKMCHLGQDYIDMVKKPKYGRGKNMNPCVDCRVMMLNWAREIMEETGAGFLITGEVLDQRPMSQTRERLMKIDKDTGLKGMILRPLSAKHLPPTFAEEEGIVDRSLLFDIAGRGRKRQYEMAKEFGITEIPQPSGGCLLTDPGYSSRLRDLWEYDPSAGARDINLLRAGRHFRMNEGGKIIVGRNENENRMIGAFAEKGDVLLALRDANGPTTLVRGRYEPKDLELAARITARYGDVTGKSAVLVERKGGVPFTLEVDPALEAEYLPLRIEVQRSRPKKKVLS